MPENGAGLAVTQFQVSPPSAAGTAPPGISSSTHGTVPAGKVVAARGAAALAPACVLETLLSIARDVGTVFVRTGGGVACPVGAGMLAGMAVEFVFDAIVDVAAETANAAWLGFQYEPLGVFSNFTARTIYVAGAGALSVKTESVTNSRVNRVNGPALFAARYT